MKINVSRDFVTELLKDMIYPELCPICGDAIPMADRAAYHKAWERMQQLRKRCNSSELRQKEIHRIGALTAEEGSFRQELPMLYDGLICQGCQKELKLVGEDCCEKCGKRISDGSGLCSDCKQHDRSFVQCRSLMDYDERMRDIMADIKYNSKREYLSLLALLTADRLGKWIIEKQIDYIIPVPVHESRLRKRGYNQSEILCEDIGLYLGIPVRKDIIVRNKKTAAQKELNAGERLLNLQQAFVVQKRLPYGCTALIVDDIYTTGSTMECCSLSLMRTGAGRVYGISICSGEDKKA